MPIGWQIVAFLAISLDLVVIYFVARSAARRFLLVIAFCATQIVAGTTNLAFSFLRSPQLSHVSVVVFWCGDLVAHAVISLLIISLIWQALEGNPSRKRTVQLLAAGVLCFALASAYIFYNGHLNRWMTPVSRNLSFCEEVLNLVLWTMLLQRRASDYLLLMVSAGIGVQVTGEVIGHTLRLYSHSDSTVWVPNLLLAVCEIVCLVIWIWAFRTVRGGQSPGAGTPPGRARLSQAKPIAFDA